MGTPSSKVITRLLDGWSKGDEAAFEKLVPVVYDELRRIARRSAGRCPPDQTACCGSEPQSLNHHSSSIHYAENGAQTDQSGG
jgi:hypothetical protein